MATYSTNEFKSGLKVMLEGEPCSILENEFVKPGKGQAFNRVKFRNLRTGRVWERTFKSGESLPGANVLLVGTRGEALDLALHRALRREHQDGDARGEGIRLDAAADLEAVHAGHGVVEHDQVRFPGLDGGENAGAVLDERDLMPRRAEEVAQHQAHFLVVVGEEQVTHGSTAAFAVFDGVWTVR